MIAKTPDLDWLLLTKRPQNFRKMLPAGQTAPNVWLGVTAENKREWNRRVPLLRRVPAAVRFVSVEPLLEWFEPDLAGIDRVICGGETVKPGQKDDDGNPAVARFMELQLGVGSAGPLPSG